MPRREASEGNQPSSHLYLRLHSLQNDETVHLCGLGSSVRVTQFWQLLPMKTAAIGSHTGCRECTSKDPRAPGRRAIIRKEGPAGGTQAVQAGGTMRPLGRGRQRRSANQKTRGQMLKELEVRSATPGLTVRVQVNEHPDSSDQHREAWWAGKSMSGAECGSPGTLDFVLLQVCFGSSWFFSP